MVNNRLYANVRNFYGQLDCLWNVSVSPSHFTWHIGWRRAGSCWTCRNSPT